MQEDVTVCVHRSGAYAGCKNGEAGTWLHFASCDWTSCVRGKVYLVDIMSLPNRSYEFTLPFLVGFEMFCFAACRVHVLIRHILGPEGVV